MLNHSLHVCLQSSLMYCSDIKHLLGHCNSLISLFHYSNWQVKLSDYIGKKYVILFFYPLDFTFVCPTGMFKLY